MEKSFGELRHISIEDEEGTEGIEKKKTGTQKRYWEQIHLI